MQPRSLCLGLPGNRMRLTLKPLASSFRQSKLCCVDFPARSNPSTTISAPRRRVCAILNERARSVKRYGYGCQALYYWSGCPAIDPFPCKADRYEVEAVAVATLADVLPGGQPNRNLFAAMSYGEALRETGSP